MTRALFALAGSLALLAITSTGHAGPPRQAPPLTKAPTARPAPASEKQVSDSAEGEGSPVGFVTWSYLKLNHPDVVVSALRERQAGTLGAHQITGLSAAEQGATRWANIRTSKPRANTREPLESIGWGEIARAIASDPQISPKSVEIDIFGSGAVTRTVTGDCPQDGPVAVTLSSAVPGFRIVKFADYDGTVSQSGGATTYKEWESRTSAPFRMTVRAGQRFKVTVEYTAPFGAPKTEAKTSLVFQGAGWSSTVPITVNLQGLDLGVPLVASEGDFTLIADTTSPNNVALDVALKVVNLNKKAFTGTLSAAQLPAGVSLVGGPISIAFSKPEVRNVRATLSVDPKRVSMGAGQIARFNFKFPGGQTNELITLEVLPALRSWKWESTKDGVTVKLALILGSNGLNRYTASFSIKDRFCGFLDHSSKVTVQNQTWRATDGETVTLNWSPNGIDDWQKYATSKPAFKAAWTKVCSAIF